MIRRLMPMKLPCSSPLSKISSMFRRLSRSSSTPGSNHQLSRRLKTIKKSKQLVIVNIM
ncbi:hypothetical protein ZEAMMB73_Zm00001d012100 [Zea mays]|uniref:Uncharacterized protein n=1 Tax=Zea mays TaxID=4577 RepID=A0A1D6G6L1_MAIZE|nr:hypothetical protein ZEAMMB73_Zm00001d036669 [Zea mays]AQK98831.1 hypothetical protein ZEAMMB73_Zm00001d012100 [Zea mays]